jgi:hypothetical protein
VIDRADTGSNPARARVRLPDQQTLEAVIRERRQEADGSWWYLCSITLIVRFVRGDGRLTAEPEPCSFWAPAAGGVVTAIEGQDYSTVPTHRDPGLLRREAIARARGNGRRRPTDEWA